MNQIKQENHSYKQSDHLCYFTAKYLGGMKVEVFLTPEEKLLLEGLDKVKKLLCQTQDGNQLVFNGTVTEITDMGVIVEFNCFKKRKKEIIKQPKNTWIFATNLYQ